MPDDRFEKAPADPRPWRERSPFVAAVDDPNELIVEGGRITRGAEITWTREAVSQVHLGYRCGICGEAQETAWPKLCRLCKRDFARCYEVFKKGYKGEKHVGTTIDFRKEMDRLDAEHEQDRWEASPTLGIIVPR